MTHCVHPLGDACQVRGCGKISEAQLSSQLLQRRGCARIPGKETLSPRCSRCRTKADPMKPVAPVDERFQFMASLFIDRATSLAARRLPMAFQCQSTGE